MAAVTIPVMAKARVGHFAEAQILQSLGVDMVDESEGRCSALLLSTPSPPPSVVGGHGQWSVALCLIVVCPSPVLLIRAYT